MIARILLLLALASPVAAASLEPGAWLSVKGRPGPGGSLKASSIEPSDADELELRGHLSVLAFKTGELRMGPIVALLDEDTDFDDENGRDLAREEFSVGDFVKVTLEALPGGGHRVEEVKKRSGSSSKLRIDAPLQSVQARVSTEFRFRMAGLEIVTDEDTEWGGGLKPPRLVVDDEDARPAESLSLGRAGTLSGEVRLDFKGERNFDLTHLLRDDLESLRLRTDLEWTLPSTPHVEAMIELRAQSEWVLHDEAGQEDEPQVEDLRIGETWVAFRELFGGRGRLEIGRNRWDDGRDWWYRGTLDSIRLRVEWSRVKLELAVAEQVLDPSRFLDHARHHLLRVDFDLAERHRLAVLILDRKDDVETRAFAPLWYGLHAEGDIGDRVSYWFDYALARGSIEGKPLRASAHDLTAMVRLPGRWEPALSFGHALGSGDPDPIDDVDRTFRQTGLHDNNYKFGGVTSLRYYGEVLRPELANLRVRTIGVSLKPRDWLSFELFWHDYQQDEPSARLVDAAAGEDRTLNLIDKHLGEEWDFIAGWERYEHWEVELNVGVFRPSDTFRGGGDDAWLSSLKVKFVF